MLKGYFLWQNKMVIILYIWSLIFGVFVTPYRLSMVLNVAQQGLKKSWKSLKFYDPEHLYPVQVSWMNIRNALIPIPSIVIHGIGAKKGV